MLKMKEKESQMGVQFTIRQISKTIRVTCIAVIRFCEENSQTLCSVKKPPIFYKRARKKHCNGAFNLSFGYYVVYRVIFSFYL